MFSKERLLKDLEILTNMDSGSYDVEGVRAVNAWFANVFARAGWKITWHENQKAPLSNNFYASMGSADDPVDLLVLCHTDTVFAQGEAVKRPFSFDAAKQRVTGPGVADMKSGCLFALYAAEEIAKTPSFKGKVGFFYNGQEEIGSVETRPIIEKYCRQSDFVIATEAVRANGNYLKQRKGIGRYTITFRGISAHAGVDPKSGQSAITEMGHWIVYLSSLTDHSKGINVNCGVVKGGTVANTVADFAELKIDVRAARYEDAQHIESLIFDKLNHRANEKISVEVDGKITRPPMVPTPESEKACEQITALGKKHGIEVTWGESGGGSDASFASGLGKPALDGLAAVGGAAHTEREYLEIGDIDQRYALFLDIVRLLSTTENRGV